MYKWAVALYVSEFWIHGVDHAAGNHGLKQICKKIFLCLVSGFSHMKFVKCLFSSQIYSFGVKLCQNQKNCSLFMPNMLGLAATIWKCPDFLPEMSGILDTRIPPFCNSGVKDKMKDLLRGPFKNRENKFINCHDSLWLYPESF